MMERCQNQVMSVMSMRGQNIFSKLYNVIITPKFKFLRLEGFGGSDVGPGVADLADYPGFAKQQVWQITHFQNNT